MACTDPRHVQILHDGITVNIERFMLRVVKPYARNQIQEEE